MKRRAGRATAVAWWASGIMTILVAVAVGVAVAPWAVPALLAPPRAVPSAPLVPGAGARLAAPAISPVPVAALGEQVSRAAQDAALPPATPAPLMAIPLVPTVTPPVPPRSPGPLGPNRLVTWYGHPDSNRMGILGEYDDPRAMIAGLKAQAAAYTAADLAHPAIPTIELVASVASDRPNADGLYLNPTRAQLLERYVQMAYDNDCLLVLDIQFGYDSIQNEMKRLLPYLKLGHVHLAIDPEFKVKRGQVPGQVFGSISAAEVAYAAQTLAGLVQQYNLPEKVLIVHQFRPDMLPDKGAIRPVPGVQLVVMMDGFGGAEAKIGNYGRYIRDEPIQYGGIKLFYKQDKPVMTPEQIVALSPPPLVVCYQ